MISSHYRTSTPDFLFSVLSVMLSRSPKRSLVINWWWVGTMPVCRLDAVSASSCSRFSRRCSSKIFCKEKQTVQRSHTRNMPIFLQKWVLNFDILTSLSPWRRRSTSSGLSPCTGEESGTETQRNPSELLSWAKPKKHCCCIMCDDIRINASNLMGKIVVKKNNTLIQCMLYSTLQEKHTHTHPTGWMCHCMHVWMNTEWSMCSW